jgi:hypothetical protein
MEPLPHATDLSAASAEQQYLQEQLAAARTADERQAALDLMNELVIAQTVETQASAAVERARQLASSSNGQTKREQAPRNDELTVGPDRIGWIRKQAKVKLQTVTSPNGKTFLFGDVTDADNVAAKNKPKEKLYETLTEKLKIHIGMLVDEGYSASLEPVKLNTTFGAYKDRNLYGSEYRAVVLEVNHGGRKAFINAAVYPHTKQSKVLSHFMTRGYQGTN